MTSPASAPGGSPPDTPLLRAPAGAPAAIKGIPQAEAGPWKEWLQSLDFKSSGAIFAVLVTLDVLWLTLARSMYASTVLRVQGSDLRPNYLAGLLAYGLIFVSILCIVVPSVNAASGDGQPSNPGFLSLRVAGLLGLVIYGIFNLTNLTMFAEYGIRTALVDTLWGTVLYALSTYVGLKVIQWTAARP
jgi:uncharacterized membrane protein